MGKSLRVAYGEALVKLGEKNDKVAVMDVDLARATQTGMFKDKYPGRFYNMGIAEANMMCTAAGFAHTGYIPFVSTFALFSAGHVFKQIRNSIRYADCSVKFGFFHSDLCVGEDGGSHQSIEDIAPMGGLSHMIILVPYDPAETEKAVMAAAEVDGSVYTCVVKSVCDDTTTTRTPFTPGRANVMRERNDVYLTACGLIIPRVLKAAAELEKEGSSVAIVNMHIIKPVDKNIVLKMNKSCKVIVTVEERSVIDGPSSAVVEVLAGHDGAKFAMVGIEDKFDKPDKPDQLFEAYDLTAANVAAKTKELLK